jgi:hypothetical protein
MANAGDFYYGLIPVIEEHAVVAATETKTCFRRLEFFTLPARLDS